VCTRGMVERYMRERGHDIEECSHKGMRDTTVEGKDTKERLDTQKAKAERRQERETRHSTATP